MPRRPFVRPTPLDVGRNVANRRGAIGDFRPTPIDANSRPNSRFAVKAISLSDNNAQRPTALVEAVKLCSRHKPAEAVDRFTIGNGQAKRVDAKPVEDISNGEHCRSPFPKESARSPGRTARPGALANYAIRGVRLRQTWPSVAKRPFARAAAQPTRSTDLSRSTAKVLNSPHSASQGSMTRKMTRPRRSGFQRSASRSTPSVVPT